jgi:hypothetical protein
MGGRNLETQKTVELGRIRSWPSLTSAYPSEDFGYTTRLV